MDEERLILRSARFLAAGLLERVLKPGDVAVDATMGNGHDTLALARLVGEAGHVYAFDVQQAALSATRARLEETNLLSRATLILSGHETMRAFVPSPPQAICFNLGWLPGAPHGVTTRSETTLAAVREACEMLAPGGLITVCVYPGHEEGRRELEALEAFARALPPQRFNALWHRFINAAPGAPQLLAAQKSPR